MGSLSDVLKKRRKELGLIWYWGGSNLNTTSDIDAVSAGLATALVCHSP